MAKGDDSRARNQIEYQGGIAQNNLTNMRNEFIPQQQAMWNQYYGGAPAGSPALVGTQPGQGGPHHPGTPPAGGQLRGNEKDIVFNLLQGRPLTPETFREIQPQLQQHGMNFAWNADGTRPDIIMPDGSIIDFATDLGTPNAKLAWQPKPGYRGDPQTGEIIGHGAVGSTGGAGGAGGGALGRAFGQQGDIYNRFTEFADTGGFSDEDLANFRSRALSPIRASHSRAATEMARQRSLQGGYSPNYTAALSRLNRTRGQALSDAAINAEGNIADRVQRGRLAGLAGMSGIYGATPGLANMMGNQMLRGQDQRIAMQGLQNQLGLGIMGNQIAASGIPGRWEHTMGRIGDVANIGGSIAGAFPG
jgi:hypothetical protein